MIARGKLELQARDVSYEPEDHATIRVRELSNAHLRVIIITQAQFEVSETDKPAFSSQNENPGIPVFIFDIERILLWRSTIAA